MKTNIVRFFMAVLSICVIINLGYQVYLKFFSPYQTEVVYEYDYNHVFEAQGIMFKNEVVIENTAGNGVIQYTYSNGSRVALGSSIAKIYQQESDISVINQIESLDKQIESLKTAQNTSSESDTSLSVLDKQLSNNYIDLVKTLENGDLSNLSEQKQSIALALNKRQILTKEIADFSGVIQQLEQQKSELQNSISSEPQEIITQYSGHFVDSVDGFEEQMTLDYSKEIKQEDLNLIINQYKDTSKSNTALGKIITKPEIMYLTVVPTSIISELKEKESYTLSFENCSQDIFAEIIEISSNKNSEQSVVAFKITKFTEEIVSLRKATSDVYLGSYSGLKISKSALHTSTNKDSGEEETGVYVVSGTTMKFKKVNIVYESEEYVLVENNSNDSGTLQLYDAIITKGKDLYDGKRFR